MLTSPYPEGSPIWADLGTTDLEGANAFYHGVFGWDFLSAGPEAGGYGMFQTDGRTAAGVMPLEPGHGSPSWTLYFATPDADATAAAVRDAGGSVEFGPMDVMDIGRMAAFTDRAGARFAVWQPGRNKGLDIVNEPGSLCWAELYTPDEDTAYAFYSSVFGWEALSMPMPDGSGTYRMVNPAGKGSDAMFGGFVPLGNDPIESGGAPYWLLYFAVTDCDAAVAAARKLDGTVRMEPTDIEGVGRFAKLADPHGARFALMRGVERAAA
ncbi:VOC family protein [Streptomyces sp. NRRL F-5135]|uniref:VOC family protein n=1 Tax=Streptomyces sp. NRRL F-5135 TaxID=1463858 RepID=UPI0004C86588|nr:VOC family protein [Streptomyces sp. NRRL F-5135]